MGKPSISPSEREANVSFQEQEMLCLQSNPLSILGLGEGSRDGEGGEAVASCSALR